VVQPQVAVTPPEGKGVKISEFGRQLGRRLSQGGRSKPPCACAFVMYAALQRQHLAGVRLTEQKHQMKWHLLGKANVGSLPRLTRVGQQSGAYARSPTARARRRQEAK